MKIRIAATWFSRTKGLLLEDVPLARDEALLLAPCRDIHTVGMRYPLDVAFVDDRGVVRMVHHGLEPGRRLFCEEAVAVLERSSPREVSFSEDVNYARWPPLEPWFSVGQRVELVAALGNVGKAEPALPERRQPGSTGPECACTEADQVVLGTSCGSLKDEWEVFSRETMSALQGACIR